MALYPISSTLQKAYRDTLSIPQAPAFIDSEEKVVPVAVIAQPNTTDTATLVRPTDGTDIIAIATDGSINSNPVATAPANLRGGDVDGSGTTVTDVFQSASGETVDILEIEYWWADTNAVGAGILITVTDSSNTLIFTLVDDTNASNSGISGQRVPGKVSVPFRMSSQQKIRVAGGVAGTIYFCRATGRLANT